MSNQNRILKLFIEMGKRKKKKNVDNELEAAVLETTNCHAETET